MLLPLETGLIFARLDVMLIQVYKKIPMNQPASTYKAVFDHFRRVK